MLRIALLVIIILHGSLHFIGLAKAFGCGNVQQLQIPTSKSTGLVWSLAGILFIVSFILLLHNKQTWWLFASAAVILSQALIITSWQDAKAGTLDNIIILIAAILSFTNDRFENSYRKDVTENLLHNNNINKEILTEQDIFHLPLPVKKYLHYTGVINKPKVKSVRIVFEGQMRDKGKNWFPFTSEQYDFFDEPTRLFFMKARMYGMNVPGYHHYIKANAVMDIRLFGLFPLIQKIGAVMDTTETVTLFNDICLMVPSRLADKRIEWQSIDSNTAKATFTNHGISISATLYFNDQGELINFISNDRTAVAEMKKYPFSTPCSKYKNFGGCHLQSEGYGVWHYPGGEFAYGKFILKEIEYNVTTIK